MKKQEKKGNKFFLRIGIAVLAVLICVACVREGLAIFAEYQERVTLSLVGESAVDAPLYAEYVDAGAVAVIEGTKANLPVTMTVNTVDTTVPGSYKVTYIASNYRGKKTKVLSRVVVVRDMTPPILALHGDDFLQLKLHASYVEPGFTAIDDVDGNVTAAVQVGGSIDSRTMGEYVLTYTVSDASGNEGFASRTVIVSAPEQMVRPNSTPTIYLTFDDGPSAVTLQVLEILSKHSVKATFFVVGRNAHAHPDILRRVRDSGHAIGLHSYTHKYSEIYASKDAFYADFNKVRQEVFAITGVDTTLFRFPGGVSNTVSKKYCPGIMSLLSAETKTLGYTYFDWNIDSGDAQNFNEEQIYQRLVTSLQKLNGNTIVVLLHDTKEASVPAVDRFIQYAKEQGYVFDVLTDETPLVQQKAAN